MKKIAAIIVILIIALVVWLAWPSQPASAPINSSESQSATAQKAKAPTFDKSAHSLTDPASLWVIVNKNRPLNPKTYTPADLVIPNIPMRSNITSVEEHVSAVMAPALEAMVAAAKQQGLNLNLQSGYRSYQFQVDLYNQYVQSEGQAEADTFSARPGYSEHQTGLAADLGGTSDPTCNVAQCFANTSEGKWLAANAYLYGFIIRYPKSFENITGYEYEPWHVRYVGKALAGQMHKTGIQTLEQFFGLPAAPNYN